MVHWKSVKRIIRYLKGTIDYKICFGGGQTEPVGFTDSDWAGEVHERRSTGGYVVIMNNGPILWSSNLQKTSALSVLEAEYTAMSELHREVLWMRSFLTSLGHQQDSATELRADNQGAIELSKNPEFHRRTKYIGCKYNRIRQDQEDGIIRITYVPTEDNLADIFTKPLSGSKMIPIVVSLNMN